ncbi:MAG: hypothetical protein ABSF69_23635 [Polyangiaceae bacterium]|jgi:hypothetical protein
MDAKNLVETPPLPLAKTLNELGSPCRVWALRRWSWMDVASDLVRKDA